MDDLAFELQSKLSPAERDRRRKALRQADASNRIEGVFRDPKNDDLFEASLRGDIEITDIVPLLKARLGLP